jgi:hypothetical protein
VLKVTPVGNPPVSLKVGAGKPLAMTVKEPAEPTVNVVVLTLVIAAAWFTVSVKFCVASVPTPLWAVNVIANVPLAAGVPPRIPVAALKVTPAGRVPVSLSVGAGEPVAVTVNEPATPAVKVVLFALVITGGWFTVSVKACVAFVPIPFWAVKVMGYVPAVPGRGVPLSTPVAVLKVTPVGRVPVSLNAGAGKPVSMIVNDPADPTVNVAMLGLVIAAACVTAKLIAFEAPPPGPGFVTTTGKFPPAAWSAEVS